jgi:hypothetical protein
VQFHAAYLRAETTETAMIQTLLHPPVDFVEVIKTHFREAWHPLIRPDLVAWAEKCDFEGMWMCVLCVGVGG